MRKRINSEFFKNAGFKENNNIAIKKIQKQLLRGVLNKSFSENLQGIYRRAPMPKYDFNKVALQLY